MIDPQALRQGIADLCEEAGQPELASIAREAADEIEQARRRLPAPMGRLRLEPQPGDHLLEACNYIAALARWSSRPVLMTFNGQNFIAMPGDSGTVVLRNHDNAMSPVQS